MLGVAGPSGGSRTAPTSVQGASTQGCEVPVFTGTTGRPPPFTLILTFSPQGRRDLTSAQGGTLTLTLSQRARGFPRLRGERRRWFAKTTYAANVMAGAAAQWGSCRLDWRYVGGGVAFGRFANRPYIRTGGIHTGMRGSRLRGNDGATAPTSVQGASTQGCEVPVFTGTTGRPPPFTLILTFSPQGRRDLTSTQGGTLTLTLSQRERGFPRLRGNDGARLSVGRFSC